MEVKIPKREIKAKFGEIRDEKIVDLRTIDSKYIIKAVEAKLRRIKGVEDGTTRSV